MAESTKPVRLSKVAREFNLGMTTVVDFLASKGIEVEAKPNTKLDPETYALVKSNFQGDKETKQKAQRSATGIQERESITLASARKREVKKEEEEPEIDLSQFRKSEAAPVVKRTQPAPAPEAAPEKEAALAPAAKEEAAPATEAPKAEAPAEAASEAQEGPRVVGKVDLEALKPKKPAKKAATKEEAKTEAPEAVKPAEAKPAEEAKPETAAPAKPAESEVVRAKVEKLSGPTVVGKIELPVEKKKTTGEEGKRKRVRVKKVDVSKAGNQADRGDQRGRGRRNEPKKEVSQEDIQKEIRATLARLSGGKKSKSSKLRRRKRDAIQQRHEESNLQSQLEESILKMTEFVTVAELATMMNCGVNEIISACMTLGIMVSINQRLDSETITIIAEEFGFEVEFVSAEVEESIVVEEDSEEDLVSRPPIVTVMGHVDHGKTSLLDFVRKANVIAGEAGGITQHIGAYAVELDGGKKITFLDTPGHEAFTAMRARGAQVTDLAIIVVAADDRVMPQTKEAINHAQAAEIPMIFAINKVDRDTANPDRIRQELAEMNILVEDWGGKYQCQEISAKFGTNVEELLEKVLLQADLLDLKANPDRPATGTVIEAGVEKGLGVCATTLVERGTLRVGDVFTAGAAWGKCRALQDEFGNSLEEAGPSTPVRLVGWTTGADRAPRAGDALSVVPDEPTARKLADARNELANQARDAKLRAASSSGFDKLALCGNQISGTPRIDLTHWLISTQVYGQSRRRGHQGGENVPYSFEGGHRRFRRGDHVEPRGPRRPGRRLPRQGQGHLFGRRRPDEVRRRRRQRAGRVRRGVQRSEEIKVQLVRPRHRDSETRRTLR
mgnify:CR=1 FL=1